MAAGRPRQLLQILLALTAIYLLLAYVAAPDAWKRYFSSHPQADDIPWVTFGGNGLPGDPVNLLLYGEEGTLREAMAAAGWDTADPLNLRDDAHIVTDTLARRAYPDAPVSRLYLFGRVEDLAFEMALGHDPARRHHVRFWRADNAGQARWLGAATLDRSVGLSSTTGQVTHHIDANVNAERDHVLDSLGRVDRLRDRWYIDLDRASEGRNAGGDRWHSDSRLGAGRLR